MALPHLLHPHDEPRPAVALVGVGHLEVELGIDEVGLVLAQVVGDAAGPRDRPGAGIGDGVGLASARRRRARRSRKIRLRNSSFSMSE